MFKLLLKPLTRLPLPWLQRLGAMIGRFVYRVSPRYSARLDENLRQSGLAGDGAEFDRVRRAAAAAAGMTAVEMLSIWLGEPRRTLGWIREVRNLDRVQEARRAGKGVLLLTPHLGCFEIAGFFFAQTFPITILYRPPRKRWLQPLMVEGRSRGQAQLATTDLKGVRRLLKALRGGEAVGLLPDQAPRFGEGVWSPFFGRQAFTMTLCTRLQRSTGCATFMVFAERLDRGGGFRLHIDPVARFDSEADLNAAVERSIAQRPEQYLWGYDRYKTPAGVDAAPGSSAARASGGARA